MTTSSSSAAPPEPRIALTAKDRDTLLFCVGRDQALPSDLAKHAGIATRAAEARLGRLEAMLLLRRRKLRGWGPPYWVFTPRGERLAATLVAGQTPAPPSTETDEYSLLAALPPAAASSIRVSAIAEKTGRSPGDVAAAMSLYEQQGLASGGRGWWKRTPAGELLLRERIPDWTSGA